MTKQNYKKQAIGLTRKQFKALLKVVYLGNWVANAYRTEDMQKEYERIEDYIFSLAPQFGKEISLNYQNVLMFGMKSFRLMV